MDKLLPMGMGFAPRDSSGGLRSSLPGLWPQFTGWLSRVSLFGLKRYFGKRRFRQLLSRVGDEQRNLEHMAHAMELQFLAAGASVQELNALAERLLGQSGRLARMSGDKVGGTEVLNAAANLIRQQLGFIQKCQQTNIQLIGRLESYAQRVGKLQNCDDALDRILTPLTTVSILYKIQSVSLSGEEKIFFAALTGDIASLQTQARASFNEQFQALLKTREAIQSAIPGIKDQSQRHGTQLAEMEIRIKKSLESFCHELDQNDARHARLCDGGQRITQATGSAVIGLQYQDITRQKWEHVTTAVQEMRERADSSIFKTWRLPSEPLLILRETSRLQVQQLTAIETDVAKAQSMIQAGIRGILEDLKQMDGECQQICCQKTGSGAVEHMAQVLNGALTEARTWMAEITSIVQIISKVVVSLDKSVTDVAGSLRQLSRGIGLIAINAQVQAAHLQGNTGLGILSEHTSMAAREVKQFSDAEGNEFDGLVRELNEITCECQTLWEQSQGQQRWLEGQGVELGGRLIACREKASADLQEVNNAVSELHQEATVALGTVDFETTFKDGFNQLRSTLEEFSCAANSLLGTHSRSSMAGGLEHLKARYTMESERALHAAILGSGVPSKNSAAPLVSADQTSHVGDTGSKQPLSATITPGLPAATNSTTGPQRTDFGDNVDLF